MIYHYIIFQFLFAPLFLFATSHWTNSCHTEYYRCDITERQQLSNQDSVIVPDCCFFELPEKLELQGGGLKALTNQFSGNDGKVWVQQKGLNEHDPEAFRKYIRISFKSTNSPQYSTINPEEPFILTDDQITEFDKSINSSLKNFKLTKVVNINKSKVSKIGKYYGVEKVFGSKMSGKPKRRNHRYFIYGNGKTYRIELEYWIKDAEYYLPSINQLFNSMTLL